MHEPRRFRITVEYDGTDFVGWQLQPNGRSVQGVLEQAAAQLFGTELRVHGAGRTDAGVHATGQVAHFDAVTRLDAYTVGRALNATLPPDVSIRDASVAAPDFHSRFSASSRSYEYTIATRRIAIERRMRWLVYPRLDVGRMMDAAACLPGTHDFTPFSKFSPKKDHCFCHVYEAAWSLREDACVFAIRANRFLHGMVRALVGGLVLVGRGALPVDAFASILEDGDRARTPMLAPPHGLVLTAVGYDPEEYEFMTGIIRDLRARADEEESDLE
jgi:tRNA pseudouridine38-40 synthase